MVSPYPILPFKEEAIVLDPERPHWFATNEKGRALFGKWEEKNDEAFLAQWYHQKYGVDLFKSQIFVRDFLGKLGRIGFLNRDQKPYRGRSHHLKLDQLKELWLHTNNSCNLACKHCLVNSSPKEDGGPSTQILRRWIKEGVELGVSRFYFTGGEPFFRPDIFGLIKTVVDDFKKELIMITNAMLLNQWIPFLKKLPLENLKLQISLDGACEKTHDSLRGKGSFQKTLQGIRDISKLPIETVITTVVHPANFEEIPRIPLLAKEFGIKTIHLMWPHLRGRFKEAAGSQKKIDISAIRSIAEKTLAVCKEAGIYLDNYESIKLRMNGKPGVKFDLSEAGWESLCIYSDGMVYPSPAFANVKPLACGSVLKDSLASIWNNSEILKNLRQKSLIDIPEIQEDPLRFFLGGGDLEHAYFYKKDPFYPIYQFFVHKALEEILFSKKKLAEAKNGFDGPKIYHAMGEGAFACGSDGLAAQNFDQEVVTLHSNCVLGFDVERPRKIVRKFYGEAAEIPKTELCCPVRFDDAEIAHIPKEVIERFYGCGSPVLSAQIQEGEHVLDLGSGAGIDCFIVAKKVGINGRVIGVDMTDRMLAVAKDCKKIVAKNLGYDVVEFREGFLEKIPLADKTADCVLSNCVINLSMDKKAVFFEMWRVLKNKGRAVFSDIIADKDVPLGMKANPNLWGECLSGALTQEELITFLEEAGFYGLSMLNKSFWKEVQGCKFFSVTVRGFKYEKESGCKFVGQKAMYVGPFKGIADEEGHYFPRNVAVEICTDTFNKLSVDPLKNSFIFITQEGEEIRGCCGDDASCCP